MKVVYFDSSPFVLLGLCALSSWAGWWWPVTAALALLTVSEALWRVKVVRT